MFFDKKIAINWAPDNRKSGKDRLRPVREIAVILLAAAAFFGAAVLGFCSLMQQPWRDYLPAFWRSFLGIVPLVVITHGIGGYVSRFRVLIRGGAMVCYAVPMTFFALKKKDLLVSFGRIFFEKYIGYYNDYYRSNMAIEGKLPELSGEEWIAAASLMFFLVLVVCALFACFCSSRILFGLPAVAVLFLDLYVGRKPEIPESVFFFAGLVFSLEHVWDREESARCTAKGSRRKHSGLSLSARLLVMILLGVGIPLSVWHILDGNLEELAEKGTQVKAFQRRLEERVDMYLALHYRGGYEQVSNQRPDYSGREMLRYRITAIGGTGQKALRLDELLQGSMQYLKGFSGMDYIDGRWVEGDSVFTDVCVREFVDSRAMAGISAQTGYAGIARILKKAEKRKQIGLFENIITYTGSNSSTAYLPARLIVNGENEPVFDGDGTLALDGGQDSVEVASWNIPMDTEKGLRQWGELSLLEDSPVCDGKTEEMISWYNRFVRRYYLGVPNSLLGITEKYFPVEVSHEERETIQKERGAEPLNAARIHAAECVRKELSACRYSLDLDEVPEGWDPVAYFLGKSRKGYCVHFASAGVMILRRLGVPARFASGYAVKPAAFAASGEDVREASVPDNCAHAWVEIYLDNIGWIPVEMTPGYTGFSEKKQDAKEKKKTLEDERETESERGEKTAEKKEDAKTKKAKEESEVSTESETRVKPEEKKESDEAPDAAKDKDEGKEFRGALILLIALTGAVILAFGFVRRKRQVQAFMRDLQMKRNRAVVLRINRMICTRLCRKRHLAVRKLRDRAYFALLKETYPLIGEEKWEKYISIVMRAGFSAGRITAEEAAFCYRIYRKIGRGIKKERKES